MDGFYLTGLVAEEPEKFYTADGLRICRLQVLLTQKNDTQKILEVTLFNDLANLEYEQGQVVCIQGRMSSRQIKIRSGVVNAVQLIGSSVTFINE